MRSRKSLVLVVLLTACLPRAAAADVPQWLADAASLALPAYPPETGAVILLDEQSSQVNPDGAILTVCRRAVKILRHGAVEQAGRIALASAFDRKIRSMTGWNVTDGKKPVKVTLKNVVETGLAPGTLYSDIGIKVLVVPNVEPGTVVGFETEELATPPSLEDSFSFQDRFPILRARYSVAVPAGWNTEALWINWPPQEIGLVASSPPTWAWEAAGIPAIENEPRMPDIRALRARLLVRIKGPGAGGRSFSSWAEMGAWYETLVAGVRTPGPAIIQKAKELTQGAPDTLSKLRALAEFVQKEIRYVAIEIGVGGFKPHPAASVLANRYGDCKDKATILASLLEAEGVEAWYLIVNADLGAVNSDSPASLYSFNHVVLAIHLPDDVPDNDFPAFVRHPKLGRWLVFDPTSAYAPLGHLPFYLQGNTALLVNGGSGELISLPLPAPEANLLDRRGRFKLRPDGTLEGEIQETRRGNFADRTRYALLNSTVAERTRFIETFLSGFFAGFVLQANESKNLDDNSRDLLFSYRFRVPNYAKAAGGMLIVRPRVVGNKSENLETNENKPRRYPIDLEVTSLQSDEFVIELAEGCRVEGLPPATDIDAGFAVYRSRTEESGQTIVYRREYRLIQPQLPADRFEKAVKFFRAMDADQRQSVLLKK
jgi:transglutaminase-like putative cysteine protease